MPDKKMIEVTHINVRQSISVLIIKLLLVELIFALIILLYFFPLNQTNLFFTAFGIPLNIYIFLFIIFVLVKMYLSFFVVFQWLNDYYEIAPTKVIHKKGLIFRKEQHYLLTHISSISLQQNLMGRILNYGTVALYDRFDKKHEYLYLIHNPIRYFHVIESLIPPKDETQEKIREHIFEEEEEKL